MNSALPPLLAAQVAVERLVVRKVLQSEALTALVARGSVARRGGRVLDPQTAALCVLSRLDPWGDLSRLPTAEARLRLAAQIDAVDGDPDPSVATRELAADGPAGPIPLRAYTPSGLATPSPGIVFLHGGGWVTGDLDTHDTACRALAAAVRCRVIAVHYRLAPEHPFPAPGEDAVAAFRWIAARAEELGIDPARLAVAGDSAGGNLSAVVSRKVRGDARRPALQVLIYPGLELTRTRPSHAEMGDGYVLTGRMIGWFLDRYLQGRSAEHPDVSPLLAPDPAGVAPALIYTAGFDPLRDEGNRYAERLREAGVDVELTELGGLVHGFLQMTGAVEAARRAVEKIAADVRRRL